MSAATRRLLGLRAYQIEDAVRQHTQLTTMLGTQHPATRAALGRLWFYQGRTPQRGQTSPEAVAWERESGRGPGYYNRGARRRMKIEHVLDPSLSIVVSHPDARPYGDLL